MGRDKYLVANHPVHANASSSTLSMGFLCSEGKQEVDRRLRTFSLVQFSWCIYLIPNLFLPNISQSYSTDLDIANTPQAVDFTGSSSIMEGLGQSAEVVK